MQKAIQIICIAVIAFVVIDTLKLFDATVNFLLVGAVPFASTSLPPTLMLAIYTAIGLFVGVEILRGDKAPIRKFLRQRASRSVPDFTKPY